MATPAEISSRITRALGVSEPELDTGVGTPIRKIIDTVAEAISESTVDGFLTTYQYDIDARAGADLDSFAALFGFYRLQPRRSSGQILLQRSTASPESILIPSGVQAATQSLSPQVIVQTLVPVVFPRGSTVIEVPVQAVEGGARGDLSAGQVTQWLGAVEGITSVTNPAPLTGGADAETDQQFRERIKKTIFRNLAGTEDMYLGISLAQRDTEVAAAYGPFERWVERIDIRNGVASPSLADAPWRNTLTCSIPNAADTTPEPGILDSSQGHFLQIGDYVYVSGATGVGNAEIWNGLKRVKNVYDWHQFQLEDDGGNTIVGGANVGTATVTFVNRIAGALDRGFILGRDIDRNDVFSKTAYEVDFTVVPPLITVLDSTIIPDGVYQFSFIYAPQASRNKPFRSVNVISDRIDTWIDGVTIDTANVVASLKGLNTMDFDSATPYGGFQRRDGSIPDGSSIIMTLPFKPIVTIPNSLSIGTAVLEEGTDYHIVDWMVNDVTGSMEDFSGIEFITGPGAAIVGGQAPVASFGDATPITINFDPAYPFAPGQSIRIEGNSTAYLNDVWNLIDVGAGQLALEGSSAQGGLGAAAGTTAELFHPTSVNYTFNSAPREAQRDLEDWRMLGQDSLVHKAVEIPLRLHVAVILNQGYAASTVQSSLDFAANTVLHAAGIGGVLQISDLLNAMADVTGVDAVRFLSGGDVPSYGITGIVNGAEGVVVTTSANHTFIPGDQVEVTSPGGAPDCDGVWLVSAVPGANQILCQYAGDATGYTSGGTVRPATYAIQRMSPDGTTPVRLYADRTQAPPRVIDIQANTNEEFTLHSVAINVRAQNSWAVGN